MRFPSALLLTISLPALAGAQSSVDSLDLTGRSSLMIGLGLTGARDASATPTVQSTHTSGELGSLAFNHWLRSQVALQISVSAMNADATMSGSNSHASMITPLLFGVSYSPRAPALSRSLRPFVSAAAGPYTHTISDAAYYGASSTSESVPGARFVLGANWFVARHFLLSLEGDYHAVGKFEHQDAVTANASGFGMSLGFGFSWGGKY